MRSRPTTLSAALGLAVAACAGRKPASIQISPPEILLLSPGREQPLRITVLDRSGAPLAVSPALSVKPPDVAVITQRHGLRCIHSGAGAVFAKLDGAEAAVPFRCALVARVEVPRHLELRLPGAAVPFPVRALDEHGAVLSGLAAGVATSPEDVVAYADGKLVPLREGLATVTARVGETTSEACVVDVTRSAIAR